MANGTQDPRRPRPRHRHPHLGRRPFYARSTLRSTLYGEPVVSVQESLDLTRFASPVVQFMLPYRIPRVG
ncbi:hypothetical protein ACFS32_22860 [Novosphingobium pokkalii]|uniref:hypothetical protein n=1 Tax=Novosphingobium pokkalii TaxID=1770194 RepID=UPI00362BF250